VSVGPRLLCDEGSVWLQVEPEKNLGRVLQNLKPANVAVGTKVRLPSGDFGAIANPVANARR
jgi:hypothetical protein